MQQQGHPLPAGALKEIAPQPNSDLKPNHERQTLWEKRSSPPPSYDANRERSDKETRGKLAGHDHAPNVPAGLGRGVLGCSTRNSSRQTHICRLKLSNDGRPKEPRPEGLTTWRT